ncbi:MAG: MFS transporter [Actinomycetota bacterium]
MPGARDRDRLVTPAFVLISLATLAYFVAVGVVLPVLPLYVRGPLGGGDVSVGVTVGAFSVTALLVRPWAGRLADRRGRRLPMLIGIGTFVVSVGGYVVAGSVPALVGMRLLTGVGEALFFTGAASAIADMAPDERRGEAISFFSLALWTGIAVGPVIGEVVLGQGRFDLVWLASAALGLLAGALTLRVRVQTIRTEGMPSRLIHRGALLPGTAILASIWGAAGFFAFVPLYSRELGLSGSRGVFVLFSGIVLAIRFLGARLPDALGPVRAARVSLVVSAAGLALMGVWGTTTGLFVATAVYAVGQALAFPALMALALRDAAPGQRGAAIATFTAMVDVGFGIGPAALGFVAHGFGYGGVFLFGAAVALLGLVLLFTRYRPVGAG